MGSNLHHDQAFSKKLTLAHPGVMSLVRFSKNLSTEFSFINEGVCGIRPKVALDPMSNSPSDLKTHTRKIGGRI